MGRVQRTLDYKWSAKKASLPVKTEKLPSQPLRKEMF